MNIQETLVDEAKAVGNRMQDGLRVAQEKLYVVRDSVQAKGRDGVAATELFVRANPWQAVGIAAGIGLVLGIGFTAGAYLSRRGRKD